MFCLSKFHLETSVRNKLDFLKNAPSRTKKKNHAPLGTKKPFPARLEKKNPNSNFLLPTLPP